MAKQIAFIRTDNGQITAVTCGKSYSIFRDHPNYDAIVEALKQDNPAELHILCDIPKAIETYTGDLVEVKDGVVYYQGVTVHGTICTRILSLMQDGLPFDPMVKFLAKLMNNPSSQSIAELYDFLEHHSLPITDDGDFYAYKAVRADWTDYHTGKIDNSIGQTVTKARRDVDDDRRRDCSNGLHVGSIEYVRGFCQPDGHIIIVKVNPEYVVSVPLSDTTKMRVCEYTVMEEYKGDLNKAACYTSTTPVAPCERRESSAHNFDAALEDDDDDEMCEDCGRPIDDCSCDDCVNCGEHVDNCTCVQEDEDEDETA